MEIKNKVAIVTGASMGIGLEIAKLLAQEGAQVMLAARSADLIEKAATELGSSGMKASAIATDMTKESDIKNMIEQTKKKFGRVDILVNNAGRGMYGAVENIDIDAYRSILELNIIGPIIAMEQVIPIMREQGGGTIINISSMVSKNYFPYLGAYASTKYALNALTLTARAELEKDKIIVGLMHPGLTATEFGKNAIRTDVPAQGMVSRNREGMPVADSPTLVAERVIAAIKSGVAETYVKEQ